MSDNELDNRFFTVTVEPAIDVDALDPDSKARVKEAYEKAFELYGDEIAAKKFLLERNPALGDAPLNASAESPERHASVLQLFGAIKYGTYL